MRIQSVRINRRIGAEGNFHARLEGLLAVLPHDGGHGFHLACKHLRKADFRGVFPHPVAEIERWHQIRSFGLHHGDTGVIHIGAVLNGIHPGLGGPQNALCAVRVRRNLAAQAVSIGDNGFHFFQCVLRGARIVALRQHAARGAYLDDIGAVLDDLADLMLHRLDAVGHSIRLGVVLKRKQIIVAMTARDAESRTAGIHARTGYQAFVDGVTQRDIREAARADIAHGGEARLQGNAGVLGADQRLFGNGNPQLLVSEFRIMSKVRMGVDQARQQLCPAWITVVGGSLAGP